MIFMLCCAAGLILSASNKVALVAGIALALVSIWALRKAAKYDPCFCSVYWRYITKYRKQYPPYSRPARVAQSRGAPY
jgi:type IV secretion system protein VirB3